jgi:hypothetical protein
MCIFISNAIKTSTIIIEKVMFYILIYEIFFNGKFMEKINSLPASSASVEQLFSKFGFIHNKLRNRWGHEKAEKLVKCH